MSILISSPNASLFISDSGQVSVTTPPPVSQPRAAPGQMGFSGQPIGLYFAPNPAPPMVMAALPRLMQTGGHQPMARGDRTADQQEGGVLMMFQPEPEDSYYGRPQGQDRGGYLFMAQPQYDDYGPQGQEGGSYLLMGEPQYDDYAPQGRNGRDYPYMDVQQDLGYDQAAQSRRGQNLFGAFYPPSQPDQPLAQVSAQLPNERPYSRESDQKFSQRVLTNFSALEDPFSPGLITDRSLNAAASGYNLNGGLLSRENVETAQELKERNGLFNAADKGRSGKLDGRLSRDDLDATAGKHEKMSDRDIVSGIKSNFRQYAAGADDRYVNFNELQEASGAKPSDRTFTPEAKAYAAEFLKRTELSDKTDVGVGFLGFAGSRDRRFDMDNLDYMMKTASATPK